MLSAAQQRLTEMIERIGRKLKDGATIALVVAEPLATILSALLKQQDLGDLWQVETQCGHWELIDVQSHNLVTK